MSAFYGLIKMYCGARLGKEQTFAGRLYCENPSYSAWRSKSWPASLWFAMLNS